MSAVTVSVPACLLLGLRIDERSLDDLPPALGLGSLHEVGDWISDRVQDAGELWFDWDNATEDHVSAGNSVIGMVPIRLDLPATLGSLRKSVAGFADRVRTRIAIAQLADDAEGSSGDEVRITDLLAGFLHTDRFTLLATIGGGWHPVDASSLTGENATPMTWLGAGHPLQILLGLSDQTVSLARPVETRGGLAGPGVLEAAEPVDVDLGAADTLGEIAAAASRILAASRRDWGWCAGCRSYLPLGGFGDGKLCSSCVYYYGGIIID